MRIHVSFIDRVGITQEVLALLGGRNLNLDAVEMVPPNVYIDAPTLSADVLEELRDALARFDLCPLRATATNLVFADGNPDSGLMFIGEAPGAGWIVDPRLADLGWRGYGLDVGETATREAWDAHRIALAVPDMADFGEDATYPIEANLDLLNAIDFKKGCYIGQETVARLKYRGGNKRAAYILTADTDEVPKAGTDIEIQLGENWRRSGQVVNAANIHNQLWIIAVLPNDITPADSLRLSSDSAPALRIVPLPYSLN